MTEQASSEQADAGRPSVAVLGTGTMGAPMARNLRAAELEVRAWNRTRAKAEPLIDDGITIADTPAEAARGAGALITMLADGDAVAAAMGGSDGALAAMPEASTWIQMSTVGIGATEELAASAAECGVAFVDAPVLGTKEPAEQGQLLVLGSGPQGQRERCRPIFDAVGATTRWLGEAGAGNRMKIVLNGWLLSLTEALAETIALAEALGVDPTEFLETIDGGPVGAPYAQLKGRAMIDRSFEPSFPLRLALKDAELVGEAALRKELELPLLRIVADQLARAAELGHGDEDMAATYWATAAPANEPLGEPGHYGGRGAAEVRRSRATR